MGGPKALVEIDRAPAVVTAVRRLAGAGCGRTLVVVGASAEPVAALVADVPGVGVVEAEDWAEGMGASLRAGLAALPDGEATAVLVTLVDLPDVTAPVMRRVVEAWLDRGGRSDDLVRATYGGRPGHPVLIGRQHWAPLAASLSGDVGAQPYLAERRVHEVSCEDLATGRDVDRPTDLEVDG